MAGSNIFSDANGDMYCTSQILCNGIPLNASQIEEMNYATNFLQALQLQSNGIFGEDFFHKKTGIDYLSAYKYNTSLKGDVQNLVNAYKQYFTKLEAEVVGYSTKQGIVTEINVQMILSWGNASIYSLDLTDSLTKRKIVLPNSLKSLRRS